MRIATQKINIALAKKGLTRSDLAKRAQMSRQNISTILTRGTCEPRTLGKLALALEVDVEDLIAKEN